MISARLKSLRQERGITKKQLSDEVGLKYSTYANYESGLREPNSEALIALSEYYGVTIDYIMGRSDIKNPAAKSMHKEFDPEAVRFAAFGELSDENMDIILKMAKVLHDQQQMVKQAEDDSKK